MNAFSAEDLQRLARHGLVLFGGRLMLEDGAGGRGLRARVVFP